MSDLHIGIWWGAGMFFSDWYISCAFSRIARYETGLFHEEVMAMQHDEIILVASGDLRLSANQTCWPAQEEAGGGR